MEDRVTRLEVVVETLQSDVKDIKIDLRALRTEHREDFKQLDDRIRSLDEKLSDRIQSLDEKLSGRIDRLEDTIHSTRLWAIWLYIALAAGLFSTMAGGFMWMVSELKP